MARPSDKRVTWVLRWPSASVNHLNILVGPENGWLQYAMMIRDLGSNFNIAGGRIIHYMSPLCSIRGKNEGKGIDMLEREDLTCDSQVCLLWRLEMERGGGAGRRRIRWDGNRVLDYVLCMQWLIPTLSRPMFVAAPDSKYSNRMRRGRGRGRGRGRFQVSPLGNKNLNLRGVSCAACLLSWSFCMSVRLRILICMF